MLFVVTSCDVVKIYISDGGEAGQLCCRYGLAGDVRRGMSQFSPADVDERKTRDGAVEECRLARVEHMQRASDKWQWVCDEAMRTFPSRTQHCPAIARLERWNLHIALHANSAERGTKKAARTVDLSSAANRRFTSVEHCAPHRQLTCCRPPASATPA